MRFRHTARAAALAAALLLAIPIAVRAEEVVRAGFGSLEIGGLAQGGVDLPPRRRRAGLHAPTRQHVGRPRRDRHPRRKRIPPPARAPAAVRRGRFREGPLRRPSGAGRRERVASGRADLAGLPALHLASHRPLGAAGDAAFGRRAGRHPADRLPVDGRRSDRARAAHLPRPGRRRGRVVPLRHAPHRRLQRTGRPVFGRGQQLRPRTSSPASSIKPPVRGLRFHAAFRQSFAFDVAVSDVDSDNEFKEQNDGAQDFTGGLWFVPRYGPIVAGADRLPDRHGRRVRPGRAVAADLVRDGGLRPLVPDRPCPCSIIGRYDSMDPNVDHRAQRYEVITAGFNYSFEGPHARVRVELPAPDRALRRHRQGRVDPDGLRRRRAQASGSGGV